VRNVHPLPGDGGLRGEEAQEEVQRGALPPRRGGVIWPATIPVLKSASAPARLPEEGEEAQGVRQLRRQQRLLDARLQAGEEREHRQPA